MLWSGSLHVGSRCHIELNLHPLFAVTLLGMTWLLAQGLLPRLFPGWPQSACWLVAIAVAAMDGLAGLLHELGHALVAVARGRRASRITLYGLVAAVRRSKVPLGAGDGLLIAMAGPLSHVLVAGVLWAIWNVLPDDNEPLRVAVGLPALSNFIAGVFNLVPVSPLDGAAAARAGGSVASGWMNLRQRLMLLSSSRP